MRRKNEKIHELEGQVAFLAAWLEEAIAELKSKDLTIENLTFAFGVANDELAALRSPPVETGTTTGEPAATGGIVKAVPGENMEEFFVRVANGAPIAIEEPNEMH